MEKWVDKKYFNFFHFVWLGMEKVRDGKNEFE